MTNHKAILGRCALLALASLAPRAGRPVPRPALPAPRPRARPSPKPDPAEPYQGSCVTGRVTWVLVQVAPTFVVLATADTAQRLNAEAAELWATWDERRDRREQGWLVLPANHLFG